MKRSKRYKALASKVEEKINYSVKDAVALVKSTSNAGFNENLDIAIKLEIDAKKADQLVRGAFGLPNGTGKNVKIIAFVDESMAQAAKDAGADEVGGEELANKVADGWLDFDIVIAHPSMMRFVGKLGKVLGPQGKMPSPKSGTVTPNIADAISEFKAGKVEFRNDDAGNIQISVGKSDFDEDKLCQNVEAFIKHIKELRPTAVKGTYISGISLSSTMGPGVSIAV